MARRSVAAKMSFAMSLIIVLVLVVLLSFAFGRPLLAAGGSFSTSMMEKLGLKQQAVERAPTEPLRAGFVSVWKATAGDTPLAALAVDGKELVTQGTTKTLILKQYAIVKQMPITLYFDQAAELKKEGVDDLSPWVVVRYCKEAVDRWFSPDDCKYTQFVLQDCADTRPLQVIAIQPPFKGECEMTYDSGVLTIAKLPAAGWYQFDIMPQDSLKVGGKEVPFNSNTAVVRFKYEP